MDGKWVEIKIVTSSNAIEPVSGIFYGLDVKGVAIEDPNDILDRKQDSLSWDFADTNIFEYGDTAAVVKGYFSTEDNIEDITNYAQLKHLELKAMGIDIGPGKVIVSAVYEEDWATEWKKYYKTTKLGKRIIIKPTWEEYTPINNELIVELDPGMAFGTGTHETTMMCALALEKYIKTDDYVLDIGTGSGILAITASKLGAKKVIGVDLDEVAVSAARENVNFNGLTNVDIIHGNLVDVIKEQSNIIVANIIADIVIYLSDIIKPLIKEKGLFITSGIIDARKNDVIAALNKNNFEIVEIIELGEWVAIVATPNN
jgi:ribosomal protein L11 methyltransferase